MPFNKVPHRVYGLAQAQDWTEKVRSVDVDESSGSQRVTYIDKSTKDINREQLDPKIVTLQSLLESGVVISPASISNMLDITDKADIERYNSAYVSDAYKFLKENEDKIFVKPE